MGRGQVLGLPRETGQAGSSEQRTGNRGAGYIQTICRHVKENGSPSKLRWINARLVTD